MLQGASLVTQLVKNLPQCRRPGFDSWIGKIPWRRERLPAPVFWTGEFHGLYSPWGRKELDTTERLSHFTYAAGALRHTSGDTQALQEGEQLYPHFSEVGSPFFFL